MNNPLTFVLTVDREIKRFTETAEHLNSEGMLWFRFNGIDNQLCKLAPIETFDLDRAGEKIGTKHVCATLSHYLVWKCMEFYFHFECSTTCSDCFWLLEYDVRMVPDWKERYTKALNDVPSNWDVLFLGSCCCEGREQKHIAGDIYEVKYLLFGHAIMYRRKALPVLLKEHQVIREPLDIAMYFRSLPKLNVYTILPPIVTQAGTYLPP
jgi:hypothetical protein